MLLEQARSGAARSQTRQSTLIKRLLHPGLRGKIILSIFALMLLSTIGSALGYVLSTTAARDRLLSTGLQASGARLTDALMLRERDLIESARILASDPEIVAGMQVAGGEQLLNLDRRALRVRERFQLDQIMLVNDQDQVRVNIVAQSTLSQIDPTVRAALLAPADGTSRLLRNGSGWVLVSQSQVQTAGAVLGRAITVLSLGEELIRQRRTLELPDEVLLAAAEPLAATRPALLTASNLASPRVVLGDEYFHTYTTPLPLAASQTRLTLLRSETAINTPLAAGLEVMLVSALVTSLTLLLAGALLAGSITGPIRALAGVARAIAGGDLSRRAGLRGSDELAVLGRAFDHATETQLQLIDAQTRLTAELQAVLGGIADGVLAIDLTGRVTQINPAAAQILGYRPEAVLGRALSDLAASADPSAAVGMEQIHTQTSAELTDADRSVTDAYVTLGGRVVRLKSAPLLDEQGVCGAVALLQDITREVAADRAKNEFIATASHELRTPLTGIVGYLHLLTMDGVERLSEDQQLYIQTLRRQIERLVLLVNDLLEMARIDQGQVSADRRWVSVTEVIEETIISLEPQTRVRSISLVRAVPPTLGRLWIDPTQLRRIISNLLSNAVKYVYDGGEVTVRAVRYTGQALPGAVSQQPWPHADERSLVIEVMDNGVGIATEDQAQIFERFYRAENPRSIEAGGTGLGLSITRALVELNGGQIGFSSAVGRGSRFWIRLPLGTHDALTVPTEAIERAA